MSFSNLKKNIGSQGIKSLQDELEKMNKKYETSGEDTRFWKLSTDKTGTGAAVIRFLPESEGDSTPWIILYNHAFQGPGGWYIENSLTTLNQPDPVSEYNRDLWTS
ncbi:MAG: single-stranded DNA-binding protein, partial [Minisyncoccia bacterium]